ncbi:YetF domain-containing protein [Paenibacillus polymyxa]|nr:YetF domain-containing protein [Paenibacillus polymyxa]
MKNEWEAIYGGTLLIIVVIIITKMMQYIPKFRDLMIGVPSVVIKDGEMMLKEIKKAKLTTGEVEVSLRQNKVGNIKDVDLAIFESNGKLSTILNNEQAAATKKDIQMTLDVLANNGFRIPEEKITEGKTAPLFERSL